ncbi:superoxide dismutase family protein [Alteromonas ponticola]|uniref:Superoxide dismutase family protein n=1 Tax=Alteromonas ponticola TaxID=2720613 RepID=A0ABX1R2T5_9ALTE|nr:superoxide dismutase family protein [Alteromonas ponticola]NMH60764.1 superoxide dismutase family protein [Alteromonas ponticola]
MKAILLSSALALSAATQAQTITMKDAETGETVGEVNVSMSDYGLVLTPSLRNLRPGGHGFHVHENPSCESSTKNGEKVAAGAAGSHYDPEKTGQHGHPWEDTSHLGDLPLLYVDKDGHATTPVLAPRLKIDDLSGRSLMVHEEGDNYADSPEKLGGGGARVLCGVVG